MFDGDDANAVDMFDGDDANNANASNGDDGNGGYDSNIGREGKSSQVPSGRRILRLLAWDHRVRRGHEQADSLHSSNITCDGEHCVRGRAIGTNAISRAGYLPVGHRILTSLECSASTEARSGGLDGSHE